MRSFWMVLLCLVLLIPFSVSAQDRDDQWEASAFVSAGRIGLSSPHIGFDVESYVGPAYSFGKNSAVMLGFSLNWGTVADKPAHVSLFLGGSFEQYIGLGYAFDLLLEDTFVKDELGTLVETKTRYNTKHSILVGALVRHPDFVNTP